MFGFMVRVGTPCLCSQFLFESCLVVNGAYQLNPSTRHSNIALGPNIFMPEQFEPSLVERRWPPTSFRQFLCDYNILIPYSALRQINMEAHRWPYKEDGRLETDPSPLPR